MGQLSLDKIYTPILTTQNGEVPCAGEHGELGKFALLTDIDNKFNLLQIAINNISITGCFTPISTTASMSAVILANLDDINYKIKNDYINLNSFNTTTESINTEITQKNVNINNKIENLKLNFENKINDITEKLTLSDSINMDISKELKNYIQTTLKEINIQIENIYIECEKSKELSDRIKNIENQQSEIQTNFNDIKKEFDVLQKQNKEIVKNLITIGNKLNGIIK